jgi:CheY-like chemotaxis protein
VTAVETAGEALAKARQEFFNLAITDLRLGSADGLELMENLL